MNTMLKKKKYIFSVLFLAATVVQPGSVSAQQPVKEEAIINAFEIQSTVISGHPYCDSKFLADQEKKLDGTMARADFVTAQAQAEVSAANVATCALKAKKSLPQWADQVGRILAKGVISATRVPGGMTTPAIASSGDRATLLLSYAAAYGSSTATEMLRYLKQSNYKTFQ